MAYNNYNNGNNGGNNYNNNGRNGGGNNNYRKSNYGNNNNGYNNSNNNGNNNGKLTKVGAIWRKMKNGREVLSMNLDGKNYLIYPNDFKQNPAQPDYNVCIMSENSNNAGSNNGYNNNNAGYNKSSNNGYRNNNGGYNNNGYSKPVDNGYAVNNNSGYNNGYTQNNEVQQGQINEYNKNASPEDMETANNEEFPDLSL